MKKDQNDTLKPNRLASVSGYMLADGEVRVWDPTTGTIRHTLAGHTRGVSALVVAPDGSWLASADIGGAVRIGTRPLASASDDTGDESAGGRHVPLLRDQHVNNLPNWSIARYR